MIIDAAALMVAVISLRSQSAPPPTPVGSPSPSSSATSAAPADTEAADRSLCKVVGPLMNEGVDIGNNFVNLRHSGSLQRDAGIPEFQAAVENWASRIQPVLDAHAEPPRILTRTLQRYIDDTRLYAASIRPGPETEFDRAAWQDRVVAYGGTIAVCRQVTGAAGL